MVLPHRPIRQPVVSTQQSIVPPASGALWGVATGKVTTGIVRSLQYIITIRRSELKALSCAVYYYIENMGLFGKSKKKDPKKVVSTQYGSETGRTVAQLVAQNHLLVFSRSHCYTVWSVIGIIMSSACPSVRLSVCDAMHCGSQSWIGVYTGLKVAPACS